MSLESQFQGRNVVRFCGIFGLSALTLAGCVATRPGFWNNDDLKSTSSKSDSASQVASIDAFEPIAPETVAQSSSRPAAVPDDFGQSVASDEKRNPFVDDDTTAPAKSTAARIRQVEHTAASTANSDVFPDTSADEYANLEKPAAPKSVPAAVNPPAATHTATVDPLFPSDDVTQPAKSDAAISSTPSIPGDDPNLPLVDAHASSSNSTTSSPVASAAPAETAAEPADAPAGAKARAADSNMPPADPTPESQSSGSEPVAASSAGEVSNATPANVGQNNGRGASPLFADDNTSTPPAEPASASEVPSVPSENSSSPIIEHAASVKDLEAADAWSAAPESPKPAQESAARQSTSQPELQTVPHVPSQSAYWMPQQPARDRAIETRRESPESASVPDLVCSSSMICDSNAVRGKFTGGSIIDQQRSERGRQAAASEETSASVCSLNRNPQEWQTEGVVHAIANQVDKTTFDASSDSHLVHAIGVTADRDHGDPTSIARLPQPEPTEAAKTGPGFSAALKPAGKATVEPALRPRGNSEAWFAIGMAVGLFASVVLWLRLRQKADPTLG